MPDPNNLVPPSRRAVLRAALGLAALAGTTSTAAALTAYQGRKRPLVVFAPATDHPLLTRQRNDINAHRLALADRDIVVVYVVGGSVSAELGAGPGLSGAALRSRFRVSEGSFRVLMLGKDGTIRLESGAPILYGDIAGDIERQPTRREDIRRGGR